MNAMDIRGLCKKYPAFTLDNVTFSVPQGAVMGFIGRNGAGKSTTLKSILGLVHPDAGEVEILGRSFATDEKYIKENIGVVLGGIAATETVLNVTNLKCSAGDLATFDIDPLFAKGFITEYR